MVVALCTSALEPHAPWNMQKVGNGGLKHSSLFPTLMSKEKRNNLKVSIEFVGNKWWGGEVVDNLVHP